MATQFTDAQFQALMNSIRNMHVRPAEGQNHVTLNQMAVNNFMRNMPEYRVGHRPFQQFLMEFFLTAQQSGFSTTRLVEAAQESLRTHSLKGLMYRCLQGEAKTMAGRRLYPETEGTKELTLDEYKSALQGLFEPASESESAKMEFKARAQQMHENAIVYLTDKVALYERAWSAGQRDTRYLCDEITGGLINREIQAKMRDYEVESIDQYEARLRFLINATRKKLLAGEISENDAIGCETHSTTMSYLGQRSNQNIRIKNEPGIHAIQGQKKDLACHYCKKRGHFIAQCPRRSAALPRTVNGLEEDEDIEGEVTSSEDDTAEVSFIRRGQKTNGDRTRDEQKPWKKRRVQFNTGQPKKNWKRIGTAYQNNRGINVVQIEEPETDEDAESEQERTQEEEVHTVEQPTVQVEEPAEEEIEFAPENDFLVM